MLNLDDLNLTFTFTSTFTYAKIEDRCGSERLAQLVKSLALSLLSVAILLKLGIYISVLATLFQIQKIRLTHFLDHCVLLEREPFYPSP